ncbi:MAG: TetR/AcrR family transcriptional regulator [Aeromicrobium sp.]
MPPSDRRAARRQEILAATRNLFDERGVRDAQIEDIAQAVGINRAIIYRHFSGKEELFAMALVGYLEELDVELGKAARSTDDPSDRLVAIVHAFLDFGERYPAFVDCAQALLRRRGDELMQEVSEHVMFRLGRAMTECTAHVVSVLEDGTRQGVFDVPNPDLVANIFYTQALGVLNLATLRISVRALDPGHPRIDPVQFDEVKEYVAQAACAMARGPAPVA